VKGVKACDCVPSLERHADRRSGPVRDELGIAGRSGAWSGKAGVGYVQVQLARDLAIYLHRRFQVADDAAEPAGQ
jgi:hypothetical protein